MRKQLWQKSANSATLKAASCSAGCLLQAEGLAELCGLHVSLPAHMCLSGVSNLLPPLAGDHCWLNQQSCDKLKEGLLLGSSCDSPHQQSLRPVGRSAGWLQSCLPHFAPSICLWGACCISYSHSRLLLEEGEKKTPTSHESHKLPFAAVGDNSKCLFQQFSGLARCNHTNHQIPFPHSSFKPF